MYISEVFNGKSQKTNVSSVDFTETYDVIVCGLGTAGSMAALMSSENGLKVLGIESFNCVGGTTTIGGIQTHYFGCPGGRYTEIDDKVSEFQRLYTRNQIESRKFVVESLIDETDGEILYEFSVIGVYIDGNEVKGVKAITPQGIADYGCRVIMDCTGDAYVAHMAGCDSHLGRALDGLTQPYSMVSSTRNKMWVGHTNRDFGRVDQYDDEALSKALIFSRSYNMEEERNSNQLMIHMPLIGVREGRHIVCEETVTMQSILDGKKTATPMFYSYADFDKHGWDNTFDGETLGDWCIGSNLNAYNATVPVPYRSVIPKSLDGLLIPCRALDVDRDVASCVRMVVDMKKLGEVGADIAALAIKHNCRLRDIPYYELSEMLKTSGCLDDAYDRGFRIDGTKNWDGTPLVNRSVKFTDDLSAISDMLGTLSPGEAIWSSRLLGEKAVTTLKKLLASDNENARKHAAFALANVGNLSGEDVLISTVIERDATQLQDCRKNNQRRGSMAVYWLGRLKSAKAVDALCEFLTNPRENERPELYEKDSSGTWYVIKGFNNRYFQFMINTVMALIRIGEAHEEWRAKISSAFKTAFLDGSFYDRITDRPKQSSEGNMILNMQNVAERYCRRWGH
ncbi:MAG: FAD-dependent oxidoreductase [Clostridia bacterium]|nr:FAD-dependent oxidoreductase [Clostridia bacterium]